MKKQKASKTDRYSSFFIPCNSMDLKIIYLRIAIDFVYYQQKCLNVYVDLKKTQILKVEKSL